MNKFKKIQEENILIPKKGKEEEKEKNSEDQENQLLTKHL